MDGNRRRRRRRRFHPPPAFYCPRSNFWQLRRIPGERVRIPPASFLLRFAAQKQTRTGGRRRRRRRRRSRCSFRRSAAGAPRGGPSGPSRAGAEVSGIFGRFWIVLFWRYLINNEERLFMLCS